MTDNLKQLTWDNHKKAEKTVFMQRLMKRQITYYQYYIYLRNQSMMYGFLEYYSSLQSLFDFENEELYPILRGASIIEDIEEMEATLGTVDNSSITLKSALDYVKYIETIRKDKEKLLAHVYVRHMGDLSGGQILKKLVPGPTRFYEFAQDPAVLKSLLRKRLHDGLADEANTCFVMVKRFLEEMEQHLV